jgi:hypothetical protein
MRYTGLSEREFSIRLSFIRGGSVLQEDSDSHAGASEDFDVVEASSPAERSGNGRSWTLRLNSDDGDFRVRARMRNFEAARLDHILDSSIAAVLGVAVGGIWRYHERVLGADAPSTAPETRSVTCAATIGFYGPDANQLTRPLHG